MKFLPKNTEWCEITEGKDFFAWHEKVDWCFGNPPYSLFTEWLYHSMKIADNICYLVPIGKVYSSDARMKDIYKWGGIVETIYYGKGSDMGFPFGFPCGAVYLKRGYKLGATFVFREKPNNRLQPTAFGDGGLASNPLQGEYLADESSATFGGG